MNPRIEPADVERAFERSGSGWILKSARKDEIVRGVARELTEFIADYEGRFGIAPDPFRLLEDNPGKAGVFFRMYAGSSVSPELRILIWRLLLGAEIVSIKFDYMNMQYSNLEIGVRDRQRPEVEYYRTSDPWDFRILHQIEMITVADKPVLIGFAS